MHPRRRLVDVPASFPTSSKTVSGDSESFLHVITSFLTFRPIPAKTSTITCSHAENFPYKEKHIFTCMTLVSTSTR